jgi:hypothetical protein
VVLEMSGCSGLLVGAGAQRTWWGLLGSREVGLERRSGRRVRRCHFEGFEFVGRRCWSWGGWWRGLGRAL